MFKVKPGYAGVPERYKVRQKAIFVLSPAAVTSMNEVPGGIKEHSAWSLFSMFRLWAEMICSSE